MDKIDINKLYVGELFVTAEEEAKKLIQRGALDMDERRVKAVRNARTKEKYHPVFTVFMETIDGYICMHNGKKYASLNFDNDGYFELSPMKNYLPQIANGLDALHLQHLSPRKVLWLFNTLFQDWKRYPLTNLYNKNDSLPVKDLFIGDTLLHKGYHDADALSIYAFASLPEMLLLEKSGATFLEMKFRNRISESGFFRGTDVWVLYESLFAAQQNGEFYNLHNHQTYKEDASLFSNCRSLCPLQEYLNRKNIPYEEEITVPEALKKYRKLKK